MASKAMQPKDRDEFEIAIICALRSEADVVEALFDEYWDEGGNRYGKAPGDTNAYTTGAIDCHNVVLVHMPGMGKGNAASVAARLRCSFPRIKLALVVGICGGVPIGTDGEEILLGDVIISTGIVQYDFGRQLPDRFIRKDTLEDSLGRPNTEIRAFLSKLSGLRGRKHLDGNTFGFLQELWKKADFQKAQYLGGVEDKLYDRTYRHKHQDISACTICAKCEKKEDDVCKIALESSCPELKCSKVNLVQRKRLQNHDTRNAEEQKPCIHFGFIASGDTVMKSGENRDEIAAREKVIGFEMEGAGVWDEFPCVVIKGVCDYADSHKNKKWQAYATATAAACMKAFLKAWVPTMSLLSDAVVQTQPKAHWYVPFGRNKLFVGRESQLEEVVAKLTPEDYESDCQRVAITGLGGIGKTQIALEAAFQIRAKYPGCSIFWVSAVDVLGFEAAFLEIGRQLQVPGISEDKANIKSLVKAYLSQDIAGRWLLIVDNADDLEMLYRRANKSHESFGSPALADYFPFSYKGSILFTTRNHEAAVNQAGIDVVTVGEMTESDSLRLLETNLINKSLVAAEDSAKQLLNLLTYLPLAIKQAAAFINQKQITIPDYLGIYDSGDQELLELLSIDFEDQGRYGNIKNPIASTWLISFRQIQRYDPLAAEYLYIMSCVAQRDIPHSLIPSTSKLREIQAIGILKAYAFIMTREGGHSYDIHRLVQITVRNWLRTTGELTRWRCETMKQVARIFPFFEHEIKDKCTMYLPHVQYILKFQDFPDNFQEPLGNLLFNIGEYFRQTGKYIESEKMYRQTLEVKNKVFGDNHPGTFSSMNNLAVVLGLHGKYTEAETLQRQTLEVRKEVLGDDHPDTLGSMNNLAVVLQQQGKYAEAETLQRPTLEVTKRVLGDNHPDTLDSMNNLALVLGRQGKYVEAETLQRQTLEVRKEVLGDNHRDTLSSMNNLAVVLQQQGKYAEAETLQRPTLEVTKRVLGDDHPDTLDSMNNLALVLGQQGKYVEAETLQRQTLGVTKRVLGDDHPDTLASMNNLAEVLREQGKYAEAETLQRQTLEVKKEVLGDNHPDTLDSLNNLALVLERQGKHVEAETLQRQTLEVRKEVLGDNHPDTLASMNNLAEVLREQGKYAEAETLQRQTLEVRKEVLGDDHPDTLASGNNLALLLQRKGKYAEAEENLNRYESKADIKTATQRKRNAEEIS